MSQIHICNTFFEKELASSQQLSLSSWLHTHPVALQLQFLPLLYAASNDFILVTDLPDFPDPRLCLLDAPPRAALSSWAPSLAIASWAKAHHLPYKIPPWETVRTINSKLFSYSHSPKLPASAVLSSKKEMLQWIDKTPGPKVLKTPFGTAASGHFHVGTARLPKEFPVIGEPWVDRLFDFSTQWELGPKIQFLGATIFKNESNGTYLGTFAGKPFSPYEWALDEHIAAAKILLEKIASLGFFGHIGIDAYVYRWQKKERLQPIVEINGRKTMSWVALQIHKTHDPGKVLFFSYARSQKGLLPTHLKSASFRRNISLDAAKTFSYHEA